MNFLKFLFETEALRLNCETAKYFSHKSEIAEVDLKIDLKSLIRSLVSTKFKIC